MILVTRYICAFRNIVSTVNLDCKLELKAIALQARNAEYNPKVCSLFDSKLHELFKNLYLEYHLLANCLRLD